MNTHITARKLGSGLAISPDKDLTMFANMARKGKHLTGLALGGHGWFFTDGPAENLVFDLTYEANPSDDYFDIFKAAGWTHVLSLTDVHIFKAAPGTRPLHTDWQSKITETLRNRNDYIRYTVIAFLLFVAAVSLTAIFDWNSLLEIILLSLAVIPLVYSFIPLCGFMRRLHRLRQQS